MKAIIAVTVLAFSIACTSSQPPQSTATLGAIVLYPKDTQSALTPNHHYTNDTPMFDVALMRAKHGQNKTVELMAGTFHFVTPPDALDGGVQIVGQGLTETYLERDYTGLDFWRVSGFNTGMRNLSIFAAKGTTGGRAIYYVDSDSNPGGWNVFEDLYISGFGTYTLPVFLDGTNKLSEPHGPRDVTFRNVSIFNATWYAFECWNCVNLEWLGGGAWQGFGSTQNIIFGGKFSRVNMFEGDLSGYPQFWVGNQR